jgi:hypothetical protein
MDKVFLFVGSVAAVASAYSVLINNGKHFFKFAGERTFGLFIRISTFSD